MAAEGIVGDVKEPVAGGDPANTGVVEPQKTVEAQPGAEPGKQTDWTKEKAAILADLKKERTARQTFETNHKTLEAKYADVEKRLQALAGVVPKSEQQQSDEEIRTRMQQLYPWMGKITDEQIDRIMRVAETGEDLEVTRNHYWDRHGREMVDRVYDDVGKELGGDLSDDQKEMIQLAYTARCRRDENFLKRHFEGDKKLSSEFAKSVLDQWLEPAKRKVMKTAVDGNRAVPRSKDRAPVTVGGKTIDPKDDKAVADLLVADFKERGGTFGR